MKKGLLAGVSLLLFAGCNSRGGEAVEVEQDSIVADVDTLEFDSLFVHEEELEDMPMPADHDEAFYDFFFDFVLNRRFQAERICFPLLVTEADGTERTITSGRVFRSEFRMPSYEMYTLLLTDKNQLEDLQNDLELDSAVLQFITLETAEQRDYTFRRTEKQWHLHQSVIRPVPEALHEFVAFYHRFVTDADYHQQHLARNIHYTTPDPDDEMSSIDGTIDAEQWDAFCPEMPGEVLTNIDFGQSFAGATTVYLTLCGFSNGNLEFFRFDRQNGEWLLSAYAN
ncbi:MAG: DUF4348 domain-containing protein [Bacteroidaceae bacterium]|nr:DUF4348 domain-containing protein [Bacteroidaceae bacterium]